MHDTLLSHADILNLWTGAGFLQRCSTDLGFPKSRVRQWRDRDSIPPRYWPRVIAVVREVHGVSITEAQLTAAAAAGQQRQGEVSVEAA